MSMNDLQMIAESQETWGACGAEGCIECLPLFDKDNNQIPGTDHWDQQ